MPAPSRRDFLAAAAAVASGGIRPRLARAADSPTPVPARAVTRGPKHHFFGYYDKTPWDKTGRYLLANEVGFIDRQPTPGEALTVGMVDLKDGDRYVPFDTTTAWGWQQGTMLQWLGSAADREVIYNSTADGKSVSIVRDVHSGKTRTLPLPVYGLDPAGTQAVTLDFSRLHRLRPGYGYQGVPERFADETAPDGLGIWHMDLATGKNALVVTLKQLAGYKPDGRFAGALHWVNHLTFNPSGTRFVFLHRWRVTEKAFTTRLFSAKPDGSDLRLHLDDGMVSHFDWRDDHTLLAWARTKKDGLKFYLVDTDGGDPKPAFADVTDRDGHCSYSPDRKWVLNDTYPDKGDFRHLMLLKVASGRRFDLNKFHSPPALTGPFRCDLHPRWDRTGTKLCVDSAHEPTRQVYVLDAAEVVGS